MSVLRRDLSNCTSLLLVVKLLYCMTIDVVMINSIPLLAAKNS